ncbi:hypothetical protein GALMADRAFT_1041600 [Galerina marginata CBS 339.88]|uniref:Protein kinase domain-containing protein n=1 Tax=Galerina marginata (strain CBS 339.88) TaxID=685588 RepID=A0A067SNM0_GALM3|nr:hypothetical protein GALMADRAFT_1041600 [Galerina marginata CBS 339.88]
MTGTLAENAAITTVGISKFVEEAEGSPQNLTRIAQLEKILHNIHKFVESETQSKFYFGEDFTSKFARFNDSLTALLGSFEQAVSRLPTASEDEVVSPSIGLSGPEEILTIHRPSIFSGAQNFVVTGGAYYNILGNYVNHAEPKDKESSRPSRGIVEGSLVVTDEEVSADRQIQKGNGYRLYSAQLSGKIVAMKVYDGKSSKERCREAAKFYQKVIHPNIPHMIGVSPLKSERSFLIFHGGMKIFLK